MHRLIFLPLLALTACAGRVPEAPDVRTGTAEHAETLTRIAVGSCAGQDQPQPIWDAVVAADPDLFLFIGDNIYGDSEVVDTLRAKYARLGAQPGYQRLLATAPVLATWDDHDYGANDAGAEYPSKEGSQQAFADFYGLPPDAPARHRDGIYDAHVFGPPGRRVQVLLLDTRFFRDPLDRWAEDDPDRPALGRYKPADDDTRTMLGKAQWAWLEERLREPADVRIIATSIQFVAEEHGWEKWANLPHERARLLRLIRETGAEGVVFVSGDRHLAELSRLAAPAAGTGYPIYDLTASSLNRPSSPDRPFEPNRHRIGDQYMPENFGLITIDWTEVEPVVTLQVLDIDGTPVIERAVPLSELSG